jgi:4-amino-4-deoxy-L-arabinose transferase-like glycosyltransferase
MERTGPVGTGTIGRKDAIWLGLILAGAVALGLHGILHYGYIGQDFPLHLRLIQTYPDGFSFRETNPPALYWLGALIREKVTATYHLETLGLVLLALNTAALWGFYCLIWTALASRPLRFAAAAVITFVPFRVIHAVVISSDAFTVPVFAAAACGTIALLRHPGRVGWWLTLAAVLSLGMLMKYSLVGLLPAIAFALVPALWRSRADGRLMPRSALGLAALALPSAIFLWEMRESDRVQGATTYGHWKVPGTPSIMRWEDILLLKRSDRRLLSAPEYFRDKLYDERVYSYAGLLHVTTFTDSHNYFQTVPTDISTGLDHRRQDDPGRTRTGRSQTLQTWAVHWTLPLSLLALFGSLAALAAAGPVLLLGGSAIPPGAAVLAVLGFGVYAPIFFSFTQLGDPYTPGYWLPRLVMPAVLAFLCLGYVMFDLGQARLHRWPRLQALLPRVALAHGLLACALFVGFLA